MPGNSALHAVFDNRFFRSVDVAAKKAPTALLRHGTELYTSVAKHRAAPPPLPFVLLTLGSATPSGRVAISGCCLLCSAYTADGSGRYLRTFTPRRAAAHTHRVLCNNNLGYMRRLRLRLTPIQTIQTALCPPLLARRSQINNKAGSPSRLVNMPHLQSLSQTCRRRRSAMAKSRMRASAPCRHP